MPKAPLISKKFSERKKSPRILDSTIYTEESSLMPKERNDLDYMGILS